MKWINWALSCVIAVLLWSLLSDRGLFSLYELHQLLAKQQEENAAIAERVSVLSREVAALKTSSYAVEEIAREEMGLIRHGEIFIRIFKNPPAPPPQQ